MLSASHEPLIDNLRSIIPPGVDMNAFFHHRVRPCAKRLAGLVPAGLDLWFRCACTCGSLLELLGLWG